MPHSKYVLSLGLSVLFLVSRASSLLAEDLSSEPLPAGKNAANFGYSTPEFTPAPKPEFEATDYSNPRAFPYGAPLISYETARTCWPHHYCKCRYSTCKRRAQCRAWGYPEEFCERPFGAYVRSHFHRQVTNGLADQMAIYQFDFFDVDTEQADQLKPSGKKQVNEVAQIAAMLRDEYFMVTIESTGDSELDHQRRIRVFERLAEIGAPIALDQIVTGSPAPAGLQGREAFEIYQNQLQQTKQQGGITGGSSSIGAFNSPIANSAATMGAP